jgi:hypothetical protein
MLVAAPGGRASLTGRTFRTVAPASDTLRMDGAVAPCIAQLFSGRSVSTSNPMSLFRDAFEFRRRPGAHSFHFG